MSASKLVDLSAFLFWYWIFASKSVTMMSWSDIPGTDVECVTIVGFIVKTMSNNLLSLVELLWIVSVGHFRLRQ